jgi:hypothetical protein
MAAAAAKARKDTQKGGKLDEKAGSKLAAQEKGGKGPKGLVVDAALQSKVVGMLRDALRDHRKAVLAATQPSLLLPQQEQQLAAERPKLQQLAERLEFAVQQYIRQQERQQGDAAAAAGPAAAAVGKAGGGNGSGDRSSGLLQSYKARVRMLCTGLRYPDGVSPELIAGARTADEVGGQCGGGGWEGGGDKGVNEVEGGVLREMRGERSGEGNG